MDKEQKIPDGEVRNEFDRSYLLFAMKEEDREEYSYQMLLQNEIKGLLNCRLRYIEEEVYYSYEITSKRSLLREYRDKKLHYKELREFFSGINDILKTAVDFLLEKEGFLLDPEYMFLDLETDRLYCVYLPLTSYLDTDVTRYRRLAEFLLDRTDHKDEHAVNAVYQFYKMSKEEFFSFDAFMGFLEKEDLMIHAQERRREEKKEEYKAAPDIGIREEDGERDVAETVEDAKGSEERNFRWKMPCALLVIGLLLSFSVFFAPMKRAYVMYFLLPGLTSMVLSLIMWGCSLYHWLKKRNEGDYAEPEYPVSVEEYFDDMVDEETVYFDENRTFRLKWKEGHFSKEYTLTTFPVTVGKLKESVQMCVDDPTISRLHARFTKLEDSVIIQDLDSTNGTWINGKRLAAGEEAVVRSNDEIQFGKIIVNVV